uniref:Uncharacterized protein n=1 Tax=Panagrellus redivivus TaxID=6233 RepID=A0A7E4W8L8_PANRE
MRFFNSGDSSKYVIISPKEKDKIELIQDIKHEEKIEINEKIKVKEGSARHSPSEGGSITQKSMNITNEKLNTNRSEGLNKKNAAFLRTLKKGSARPSEGSGFKRI